MTISARDFEDKQIYDELRRLWIEAKSDPEDDNEQEAQGWTFDSWLTRVASNINGSEQAPAPEVSRAQMIMEVILEVEQVAPMVPPRVKSYRDLLAAAGLDRGVADADEAGDGQKGLPGINLADQAALEYHSNLLGMAFGLAQEEVADRIRRKEAERENDGPKPTMPPGDDPRAGIEIPGRPG